MEKTSISKWYWKIFITVWIISLIVFFGLLAFGLQFAESQPPVNLLFTLLSFMAIVVVIGVSSFIATPLTLIWSNRIGVSTFIITLLIQLIFGGIALSYLMENLTNGYYLREGNTEVIPPSNTTEEVMPSVSPSLTTNPNSPKTTTSTNDSNKDLITCRSNDNKCPSVQMTEVQCAQSSCCQVNEKWILTSNTECLRLQQENAQVPITTYNGNVYYCDKNSVGSIQSASIQAKSDKDKWLSCESSKRDKIRTCENDCYKWYKNDQSAQSSCINNCDYGYCESEKMYMESSIDTLEELLDRHCE